MTINERLFVCGLFEASDEAVENRDREKMMEILVMVEADNEADNPVGIIDTVLAEKPTANLDLYPDWLRKN